MTKTSFRKYYSLVDLSGAQGTPRAQILSISCSFWENLAKLYVGAPPPPKGWRPDLEGILDPPLLFKKLAETLPVGILYYLFSKLAYGERDANPTVCQFSGN